VRTRCTIMVADSCPAIRTVMTEFLADQGYLAHCFPADHRTIDSIRRTQPDLVILEMHPITPHRTLLLLDRLRRHEATRAIPVLVSSTDERLLDDLAMPLDHLNCITLSKPFDLDQLLICVTEALHRSHLSNGCF